MLIHVIAAGGGLGDLATNATTLLAKVGGLLLVVFVGFKALGHIAQDQFGKAVGLLVVALIPAAFLFDTSGAKAVLTATLHTLGV